MPAMPLLSSLRYRHEDPRYTRHLTTTRIPIAGHLAAKRALMLLLSTDLHKTLDHPSLPFDNNNSISRAALLLAAVPGDNL
jgi:hypothetical protein